MSVTLSKGQKVKVRYIDAANNRILWDGVLKEQVSNGWRVDVGGVTIVFATADIVEIANAK